MRQGAAKRCQQALGTIRRLQKVSKSPSDGFKIASRAPTMSSIQFQELPRRPQAPPQRLPNAFKSLPRGLQTPPRALQSPSGVSRRSTELSRHPEKLPKRPPNALRSPSGLQMPFRAPLNLRGLIPSVVLQANHEPRPGRGI